MSRNVVAVTSLRKLYRSSFGRPPIRALDGISFAIEAGQLFGLLGPNGAGKTTTVKILLGLTHATDGVARIHDLQVTDPESRRRVGYLPEGHKIPGYLTARQTLSIFGRMSGMEKRDIERRSGELLERLHLSQWIDVRVKKYSKGMTQRLGLACALIHSPDVLLLDEPTDGVDPVGRREIRDILRDEAKNGTAVLINSHLLSEIELTCDHVAVLRNGKVAAAGTVDELTRKSAKYRMIASPVDEALIASFIETGAGVDRVNGHFELSVSDAQHLNVLIDKLRARGGMLTELAPIRSSLEDVFVDLIKTSDAAEALENGAPTLSRAN